MSNPDGFIVVDESHRSLTPLRLAAGDGTVPLRLKLRGMTVDRREYRRRQRRRNRR